MEINHRKLLPEPESNQNSTCSDCGPTCPYKCSYPEFFWPPQPPPQPPHITTATHLSPYVIIVAALLGSAFLFISYYLIMVRCYTRFRRPPATQISGEAEDFSDEDHTFEVDHPIWYITTVGLQPSVINSITIIRFKKDDNLIDGTDCSVCLSEFQDDETLRLLPKCILSNTLSAVLSPNDRSFSHRSESNQNTQIENSEDDVEIDWNLVPESEICEEIEDSKTEHESITAARISISMDSVAEINLGEFEGGFDDSTRDFQRSDSGGDSRT
ncbi:RING-H2 finger protein ATL54-like [Cynara cardunculus var. scolymus]|uniref:RING-H2 finger protein ATL54-like n=1 Tax=Cynara cardunculus var. scolymus TaxID=59895 RepID=UPI000D628238|nr:RING-H2 finger protein ATL54-like [Cynara cardunculus var. scolymus]